MSDEIKFEEENSYAPSFRVSIEPKSSAIIRFVLKTGIVRTKKQVEFILLGFIILTIGASFYLVFGRSTNSEPFTPSMIQQFKQEQINEIPAAR